MIDFTGKYNGHDYRGEFERDGNLVKWGAVIDGVGNSMHTRSGELTEAPPAEYLCLELIRFQIHEYIDGVVRA